MPGLAAVQMTCVPGDVEANALRHVALMAEAAALGGRLVVFPELSLTGYELGLIEERPELTLGVDDPTIVALDAAARSAGVVALVGAAVAGDGGRALATVVLGRADGESPLVYAKQYVDETEHRAFPVAGPGPVVVHAAGLDVAPAICRDTRFPAHADGARALGAGVYAAGALFDVGEEAMVEARMAERARTTGMWVVLGQHVGPSGEGYVGCGGAGVWNPAGERVADAGRERPGVAVG